MLSLFLKKKKTAFSMDKLEHYRSWWNHIGIINICPKEINQLASSNQTDDEAQLVSDFFLFKVFKCNLIMLTQDSAQQICDIV